MTNSGQFATGVPAQDQLMCKQGFAPIVVAAPHRGGPRNESVASHRGNAKALQVRNHLKREQFLCRDRVTSATGCVIETLGAPVDRSGHYGHERICMTNVGETPMRRRRAAAAPHSIRPVSSSPDTPPQCLRKPEVGSGYAPWHLRAAVGESRRTHTPEMDSAARRLAHCSRRRNSGCRVAATLCVVFPLSLSLPMPWEYTQHTDSRL